ncbi:hypothetical protein CONCODRAFT_14160 [Conidiobolus coronatus NRRL 28638]|uniref:Zn(2)-C6 fungal-type domain-containing protein n=1 Tax=Conidiobolus coronatus (strain ATCC 28846 / CBS 209.66 / NRRL 28638) TaxID=796925 RepID=A0A137NPJ4_CONC2|nr:hypothetical protein CONCODRAFT_14160 [Conidiobolus coronatus NRRL 28638]|eukprot:KXN64651.1 hypothetical protein CONCODRAFT_14160 [Conidiobolus coronatus NRRL 28638]
MQTQQTSQTKLNTGYSKIPCDGCKGHHIKCDKSLDGCKNCSRRGISCTYLITRKRRGPKTKTESMIKLIESLNISNQSTEVVESTATASVTQNTSTILVDNEIEQNLELQSSAVSSPMQATPVFSNDFTMPQAMMADFSLVYQDICSLPMYDPGYYNLPLPLPTDAISFDPSFTIPTPCDYFNWYPQLPQFQPIESLDQAYSYYNPQNLSPSCFLQDQNTYY